MDSKDQVEQTGAAVAAATGKDINIDINGEPDTTANVKSMDSAESPRAGLTKDELMKYANMPFWVRLRNTLFAAFWIVWISILVAAIGYVVASPGCKVASATSTGANVSTPAPSTSTS